MAISFITYGKIKRAKVEADFTFDCRFIQNPPQSMFHMTGQHLQVQNVLYNNIGSSAAMRERFAKLLNDVISKVSYRDPSLPDLKIAFFCIGGRHRSVFVAEHVAAWLKRNGIEINVRHLELQK